MHTNRIRRHWRSTTRRHQRTGGAMTASRFLTLQGAPRDFTRRFAAQLTRTAKKLGTTANDHTWTVRHGHARRAAAYTTSQLIGLITAFATYQRTATAAHTGHWA